MKKIVCVLLAMAMLFAFTSVSLADSVWYKDGVLSVSVDEPSWYSVWVDGKSTKLALSESETHGSIALTLSDGKHTVTLEDPGNGVIKDFVITVGSVAPTDEPVVTPEVTTAPTDEPVVTPEVPVEGPLTITSASYNAVSGTLNYTVSGLKNEGEAWVDGAPIYQTAHNGANSVAERLDEGTYTLTVHNPFTGESASKSFTVKYAAPVINSVSYTKVGQLDFSVSSITNECEVWLDGSAIFNSISADGSYIVNVTLKEGAHTLEVHNPFAGKSAIKNFTVDHIIKTLPAVPATCTETGKTEGQVCEICGKVIKAQETVAALGHEPVVDPAVAPTCTKTGLSEGSHCGRCGEVLKAQEVVEKSAHTPVAIPAVPATCTETGLSEGSKCSVCGEILKAQEVVEKAAHTAEAIPAVAATCTKSGLSEGKKCSVCGAILAEQTAIPALGHKYVVDRENNNKPNTIKYVCERCGDFFYVDSNKPTINAYGNIVKDANMVDVDYEALVTKNVLEIVADLDCKPNLTTELGLYLDDALIAKLMKDGIETIAFVNGDVTIEIKLADIKADWFNTNDIIWAYVFSTDPAAEGGILVKVEAQVSGTEKIPAEAFTGVTLKATPADIEVTANGIY